MSDLSTKPPTVNAKIAEGHVTLPNSVRLGLFRHPYIAGDLIHDVCGRTMHDHGWVDPGQSFYVQHADGLVLCPPDVAFGGTA